ncbi:MAG TPA: hypothetical protein VKY74_06815, partial [Chloroflexia bacterium]|nr:hypothetical protein [Chloroflexia bacterium]
RHYCNGKSDLTRLTADEIADLHRRLLARVDKQSATPAAAEAPPPALAGAGDAPRARQRRA